MRKIMFAAFLAGGIALTALTASAGDNTQRKWRENRDGTPNTAVAHDQGNRYDQRPASEQRISAQDMSTVGLLAASAMAAGIYAIRRRAKSRT